MAPSTDRPDNTTTRTGENPLVPPTHQRRDMAVVWWSTYLAILFLALFVYGLPVVVGVLRDPASIAVSSAALGALSLISWAVAVLGARHGVSSTTFRTRTMAFSALLAFFSALTSLGATYLVGVGALPFAIALATAALSLPKGRWWVVLAALFLPAAHLSLAIMLTGEPADSRGLVTVAWLSLFTVLGVPTSLWIWAVMVELDVTRQRAAELAITNERLRFAADLHDVQGHHLQVISLKTDLATRLLAKDRPDDAAPHIHEAHQAAQSALRETRSLVQGYRKTTLTQELNNASAVLESAGVRTHVNMPALVSTWSQQPSSSDLGAVLGLTVREATTNILRHSQARTARFDLSFGQRSTGPNSGAPGVTASGAEVVELRIRNDGAATQPARSPAERHDGSGLNGLRLRLSEISGQISAETTTDGDFVLHVLVPKALNTTAAHEKDPSQ